MRTQRLLETGAVRKVTFVTDTTVQNLRGETVTVARTSYTGSIATTHRPGNSGSIKYWVITT